MTVSCCYITEEDGILRENWHQLALDRVEDRHYVLQNTLINESLPEMTTPFIKIEMDRPYYLNADFVENHFIKQHSYQYFEQETGVLMKLVNIEVDCQIETYKWYLFPTAYSIQIIDKNLYV